MSDVPELPNALVEGFSANKVRIKDDNGADNVAFVISFQFHVGAGDYVARQNFIMHPLDAKELRAMMKNPAEIQQAEEAQQ